MTLRATMACGSLSLREVLDVAVQVGSALAAAHESGIVHRDIKPENIMRRPDGYVKVLDFGIAKLTEKSEVIALKQTGGAKRFQTQSGVVSGTVQYMSPEQARGQGVDARTDIWSFGVVLYETVAGRPPFDGATSTDCIAAILKKSPPCCRLARASFNRLCTRRCARVLMSVTSRLVKCSRSFDS